MSAKPAKPASAQDRTVSMFTGMTDAESSVARDGHEPSHPQRKRRRAQRPPIDWKPLSGSMSVWLSANTAHRIELDAGGNYNVTYGSERIGAFRNIVDAVSAAERRQ